MTEPTIWWVNQYAVVPSGSGGTRHYDMARELRRHGFDARIVASDLSVHSRAYDVRRGPGDVRAFVREVDGVPFHWLPAGSYEANDWRRAASMLVFSAAVLMHLLSRRMGGRDVVIGSSPHLFAALAAWVAARMKGRPFVLEVRDLWPESYTAVSGSGSGTVVRLMRLVADFLYRRSDAIVVLARGSQPVIEKGGVPAERITWIPNGVDTASFPERQPRRATAPVRFVYTGAHGPANGLDVAIRAAADVRKRGRDDIELVLVGDGPVKAELVELARALDAPVQFTDPVPKSDIPKVLGDADAGLMVLADVELFQYGVSPNKLFDYLAAGLPVLTNVPGFVTDVVNESGAGLFVAPGDPQALADGMEAMADRRLSEEKPWPSGRSYIEERFDRRILAGQLEDLLRSLSA